MSNGRTFLASIRRILLFVAIFTTAFAFTTLCRAQGNQPLGTFNLQDDYGVAHPRQIVDFPNKKKIDGKNAYLVGPEGTEVPYQILQDGSIAVETDLPVGAARSWKLMGGRAPKSFPGGVQVKEEPAYYEITNGLTGVRVAKAVTEFTAAPAPVQGILLRDGTWTATGPNLLSPHPADKANPTPVIGMAVKFLERGPLTVKIEVAYRINRPDKADGTFKPNQPPVDVSVAAPIPTAPGEGYYLQTIELQANQPSILFEEDTDSHVHYGLDVYKGLHPTQARYRGHHSTSAEAGRDPEGKVYNAPNQQPAGKLQPDATVDVKYDKLRKYQRFFMSHWDPWAVNTGWYWQYYDDKGDENSNLLGTYAGPASRLLGVGFSGISFVTAPAGPLVDDKEDPLLAEYPWQMLFPGRAKTPPALAEPTATIVMGSARRDPGARIWPRSRFDWALFVGTKKDLLPPYETQPINQQFNVHSGINLNKIVRLATNFPDPPQGYGALFMERKIFDAMLEKARKDEKYYKELMADAALKPVLEMQLDPTGAKTAGAIKQITTLAQGLLNAYVNRNGIYDFQYHYFHGALQMSSIGVTIDQVLSDPRTSAADRAKVKAAAALFAGVSWDDDFAPLYAGSSMNLGPYNMPVMMEGNRTFYALLLAGDPTMQARVKQIEQGTLETLRGIVNEHGAEVGSVHYIGASFIPTHNALLQLRMLGKDHFGDEPRLAKFAEFYMNFLGPPEVRFGGKRKQVAIGDGSPESSSIYGRMATGFRTADPKLSARLMSAWWQGGWHDGFMGTSRLQIDETAPTADPKLGSATFPGYYSVLRSGWGTPQETALWVVNGNFYMDHRHEDYGSISLYALCAPISLDWGSLYYPRVAGAYMHNRIVPVAHLESVPGAAKWDVDSPTLESGGDTQGRSFWTKSSELGFRDFEYSSRSLSDFTAPDGTGWQRENTLIHANSDYPVILMRDSFSGKGEKDPKVFTLALMAQGEVDTPAGKIMPIERTYGYGNVNGDKKEMPSNGKVFALPAEQLNRFGFKGQWGVDWDLYTFSATPQEAFIGNWGNNWAHNPTMQDFQAAMKRPYEERQHILRIKGDGSYLTVLLPYREGTKRADTQVTQTGGVISIKAGEESIRIENGSYVYHDGKRHILTTFGAEPVTSLGITAQGGPMEIVSEAGKVGLTLHGPAGVRRFKIPGNWSVKGAGAPVLAAGEWSVNYAGGAPVHFEMVKK